MSIEDIKWPFYFPSWIEWKTLSGDMQSHILNMGILSEVSWFKDRINSAVSIENSELREIEIIKEKIYKKYLDDFKYIYPNWKKWDTVLFNIPSAHASSFLPVLIEEIHNPESELSKYKVEYIIMDSPSVEWFWNDEDWVKQSYEDLKLRAEKADKFIEINDYQWVKSDFIEDIESKKEFKNIETDYANFKKNLKSKKPYWLVYFPSQQQAELSWMSLLDFSKKMYLAWSIDWERITEANEELAELFREYDNVKIKWDNTNIEFDIKWMWAINSVVQTNYPGAEVYTSPNIDWVNWWIKYENQVRIKEIWETITWLKFYFKGWRLEKVDIIDPKYSPEEKEKLIIKFEKMLWDNENNRRVAELAFWTNFHVLPGFLHSLIWEKAWWMHFAIWRSYNNPEDMEWKNQNVNNWNGNADFHIDMIRNMSDGSIVTFSKEKWETVEVMNNWIYNAKILPKLHQYQNEIQSKM